ncbi:hypothetical protein HanRHA438_Chr04g0167491 [Helianthus annuus]|uniref:Uncharacterized protein n=1 Tax=Helianthus annuus TaxID=4232 RepID=A0A9K3NS39_HELAN|nr:hypothetical protein HanXRQr2_Chr04g0157321 [Helianthus annuus]KAJ0580447.1 hypothetical protein HanHA300_Chr04g0129331 [Helianthus annuus]KAJ0588013.1 hypothetical protein HanIR_Chr04g0169731 [Helianthus annuus]KAJ0596405.1 hypothetical protein HanHA89_Chr04g0142381 [Helianthus annuus]KAJ0757064.1 hypothetical protein HanLR1_Chr04g0134291 [Helianthus annuus]
MDLIPKIDSVHISPDPPPDLGFGSIVNESEGLMSFGEGYIGKGDFKEDGVANMNVGMESMKTNDAGLVSAGADKGIIRSVVLTESDIICLGNVLGENWKSRVLSEKIVFNNSDLKVSFSVDSGLEDFKAGCVVNLLINELGSRVCSSELFSGQYGSVLEVLAKLAKQRDVWIWL